MSIHPTLKTLTLQTLDILYSGGLGKPGAPRFMWKPANRPRFSGFTLVESNPLVETWGYSKWEEIGCSNMLKCKYFIFENNKTSEKTLFIIFCYGKTRHTEELEQAWTAFRSTIITQIRKAIRDNYNSIVIGGQSAGAAMSYYYTTKLYEEGVIQIIPAEQLNIIVFGLGRIPTRLVNNFAAIYEESKFNVIDIITYNSSKNIPDTFLDSNTLYDNRCDIENPQPGDPTRKDAPYYCQNRNIYGLIPPEDASQYGKPPMPHILSPNARTQAKNYSAYSWGLAKKKYDQLKKKEAAATNAWEYKRGGGGGAGSLSEQERKLLHYLDKVPWADPYIERCSNYSPWGVPYGELYNECQRIHDIFHSHTKVNTYSLNENGNLEPINKNNFMLTNRIRLTNWGPRNFPKMWGAELAPPDAHLAPATLAQRLHEIKSYNQYFKTSEKAGAVSGAAAAAAAAAEPPRPPRAAEPPSLSRVAAAAKAAARRRARKNSSQRTGGRRRKRRKTIKRRKKKRRSTRRRK
jgi:hypothetical protein